VHVVVRNFSPITHQWAYIGVIDLYLCCTPVGVMFLIFTSAINSGCKGCDLNFYLCFKLLVAVVSFHRWAAYLLTERRNTQREVFKVLLQLRGGGEEPKKPTA
jgi:hypothetical protein